MSVAELPVIRVLIISVDHILRRSAARILREELLEDLPEIEPKDIRACLLHAAGLVAEERVYPIVK